VQKKKVLSRNGLKHYIHHCLKKTQRHSTIGEGTEQLAVKKEKLRETREIRFSTRVAPKKPGRRHPLRESWEQTLIKQKKSAP